MSDGHKIKVLVTYRRGIDLADLLDRIREVEGIEAAVYAPTS